ncbi:MAG: alpha/beta hydrolase [Sporichthyaceae bacterium]
MSRRLAVFACVAALVVAGCSSAAPKSSPSTTAPAPSTTSTASPSPTDATLARFYGQKPTWKGCQGGFVCARLDVPLDYADPGGKTIQISVNRLRARSMSGRIGSLLVNPGGPGGSGLNYARAGSAIVGASVLARFDLVGFDPRGVGESTPVRCFSDAETDTFLAADGSPDTAAEEQRLVTLAQEFGKRCAEHSGDLLGHVSTVEAARDLDVLRAVLGDEKLNLLGKSYGTYLGATYAELFPARVGRLVLDGALDPKLDSAGLNKGQALGFEVAFTAFVDDCVARSRCPLRGGRAGALAAVRQLLARIDGRPLDAKPGRPLTQGLAMIGLAYGLYDKGFWPGLRQGIDQAMNGDGSTLLVFADLYAHRDRSGRYPGNSIAAQYAVNCLDRAEESKIAAVRATADQLEKAAPIFGAYLGWSSLPCGFWPVPATAQPHAVRAVGAPPILVVGTRRDPATPCAWAVSLAKQLASGRMLTYVGDGHTAYSHGNRCVDQAVNTFFLEGRLPAEGTRCR